MIEYKFTYGKEDFAAVKKVRELVFVEEQGFEQEFDEIDNIAYHLGVYQANQIIGCARMYPEDEVMVLGRIAILKEYRGNHRGQKIIQTLEAKALELGYLQTKLSAQQRVQAFYEKQGYQAVGEPYLDEWCLHITMKKVL